MENIEKKQLPTNTLIYFKLKKHIFLLLTTGIELFLYFTFFCSYNGVNTLNKKSISPVPNN